MAEIDDLVAAFEKLLALEKSRAELETTQIANEQSRIALETTRISNDQARVSIETTRLAQRQSELGLETTRLSNAKADEENRAARVTNYRDQLSKAVPDFSSLAKNTVTFSDGRALRQGEATALALGTAAADVAAGLATALTDKSIPADVPLFVTSDPNISTRLIGYQRIMDEGTVLEQELARTSTELAEAAKLPDGGPRPFGALGPDLALAAAGALGTAITEVASLFEQDVAVRTAEFDVPAVTVHAAVISALLETEDMREVRHETLRAPVIADSPLLAVVRRIIEGDLAAAELTKTVDDLVTALGDPAADLKKAKADLAAEKDQDSAKARSAQERIEQAEKDSDRLAGITPALAAVKAVVERMNAFTTRITGAPTGGGQTPLEAALSIEFAVRPASTAVGDPPTPDEQQRAAAAELAVPFILVITGAKAESSQFVVTRRISAPRLQTAVAVGFDYFLVRGDRVHAAGRGIGNGAYHALIDKTGADWTSVGALPT